MDVCIVPKKILEESILKRTNWDEFFISTDLFGSIDHCLTLYFPHIINVFRGERTGWNDMFVVKKKNAQTTKISSKYLIPYIKKPAELQKSNSTTTTHTMC